MNKNQSLGIWLVVGILVLALASMLFTGPTTSTKTLSYTEFLTKVKNSEIKQVVIDNDTVTAKPVNDEIKTNIDGKETNYAVAKSQNKTFPEEKGENKFSIFAYLRLYLNHIVNKYFVLLLFHFL